MNSGGKATNAGVDYQQRVAAWFLTAMWLDLDISPYLSMDKSLGLKSVGFETSDEIDDLKLACTDESILYLQIKRAVSLSSNAESEFGKTICQFTNQFLSSFNEDSAFLLVTTTDSSKRITNDLRQIANLSRLSSLTAIHEILNKQQVEVLNKCQAVFEHCFKTNIGRSPTCKEFDNFLNRVFVTSFDIGAGMSMERATLLLLGSKSSIDPALIWALLVQKALQYSATRAVVTLNALISVLDRYSNSSSDESHPARERRPSIPGDFRWFSGREIFLLEGIPEKTNVALVELFRYDNVGTVRNPIHQGCISLGEEFKTLPVLARAATRAGMERLISLKPSLVDGRDLTIIPAKYSEDNDPDASDLALQRETRCKEMFECLDEFDRCIHCDMSINESDVNIVEIDESGLPHAVGISHSNCLRPTDRTVGHVQMVGPMINEHLASFDVRAWCAQRQWGQRGVSDALAMADSQSRIVGLVWNRSNSIPPRRAYCIRIELKNGWERYILLRGRIHRMSKEESDSMLVEVLVGISDASKRGDPYCYTSEQFLFGPRSSLVTLKQATETCIECVGANSVRYSAVLDKVYDTSGDWYAPLAYFVTPESRDLVALGGLLPLISDPRTACRFIQNWRKAGFDLPSIQLDMLETDLHVDRFFAECLSNEMELVIDPLMSEDASLISGTPIRNFDDPQKFPSD